MYQPLTLKYRPQTFSDVKGQDVAVKILKNMILRKEIYPGLVFYGQYGSGKTTLSRVFSKALNCRSVKEGEPCDECICCVEITNGSSLCYVELSAALHGQVDHARKISELVQYKPVDGDYRVICLDECHMLTTQAWNALLKILEEPPPNVVFIFVTTAVNKIPDTILSRCFVIPFKTIDENVVVERLHEVAVKEGIKISRETLNKIAYRAGGAMRNAISYLDQMWKICGSEIAEDKLSSLGICDDSIFMEFLRLGILEKSEKEFVALYRKWSSLLGIENFLKGLELFLRDMLLNTVGVLGTDRKMMLGLSKEQVADCIDKIWRVLDATRRDFSRVEILLLSEFFIIGDSGSPEMNVPVGSPHAGGSPTVSPMLLYKDKQAQVTEPVFRVPQDKPKPEPKKDPKSEVISTAEELQKSLMEDESS